MEGAPEVFRVAEVAGDSPTFFSFLLLFFFYVLVSVFVLLEGPVGNGSGTATLQSHFLGPPGLGSNGPGRPWERSLRDPGRPSNLGRVRSSARDLLSL